MGSKFCGRERFDTAGRSIEVVQSAAHLTGKSGEGDTRTTHHRRCSRLGYRACPGLVWSSDVRDGSNGPPRTRHRRLSGAASLLHRKGCREPHHRAVTHHPRPTCGTRASARTSSSRGSSATCAAGGSAAWCATCRGRGIQRHRWLGRCGGKYLGDCSSHTARPRGPAEASRSSTSRASHRRSPPRSGCTESPWSSSTTCWRRRTGWNRARRGVAS